MIGFDLPNTWRCNDLRDLATINYGKSPKAILADDSDIPVVGTGGVERYGNDYLCDGESIILGRKGTIDKVAYVVGKFWAIDTAYFLSDFQGAKVQWLYYFLQSVDFRLLNEATGVPSLSRELLYKIQVPMPSPDEQAEIAAILSTVDKAIEQTEIIIAKQRRVKTGLMQDLLTKGIDDHGNIRSEATHAFKSSPLGRIPVEWDCEKIHDVLELIIDYRGRTPKKLGMEWGDGEIPALSANNVEMGQINFSKETYYGSDALYLRWMTGGTVLKGDVIMTTEAPLGNVAQIQDRRQYILSQRVILLRGKKNVLLNDFLVNLLMWEKFQNAMTVQSSGTTATGIQRKKFEKLFIALPKPKEQEIVFQRINGVAMNIESEAATLSKLRSLKIALMQDLLTGKVRVTSLIK